MRSCIFRLNSFLNFESPEWRNIVCYALGMMFYKFSLETMNVSVSGIVLNRLGISFNYLQSAYSYLT